MIRVITKADCGSGELWSKFPDIRFRYTFKSHVLDTNRKDEILKYNYLYGYSLLFHLNICNVISS